MPEFEAIIQAIEDGDSETALGLLRAHPRLTHQRYRDEQLLHIAIRACNVEIVNYLLAQGADVNSKGNRGESPLHYAIRASQPDIVQMLLKLSPNVEQEDDSGFTPLLLAARTGEGAIADELLKHGANLDFHSAVALGRSTVVSNMLKEDPNIYKSVRYKNDLLPDAVYANSPETVEVLLNCPWVDVHAYGLSGEPPLAVAVSASYLDPKMAEILLSHGADPHQKYGSGQSVIDKASRVGTLAFLKLQK